MTLSPPLFPPAAFAGVSGAIVVMGSLLMAGMQGLLPGFIVLATVGIGAAVILILVGTVFWEHVRGDYLRIDLDSRILELPHEHVRIELSDRIRFQVIAGMLAFGHRLNATSWSELNLLVSNEDGLAVGVERHPIVKLSFHRHTLDRIADDLSSRTKIAVVRRCV